MEVSFSVPPPPPVSAPPAPTPPLVPAAAVPCSSQRQPEAETAVVAPAWADDRFHVSGMFHTTSSASGVHINDVEFGWRGGSDLFGVSVFFPVAVEVLLHATTVARHEETQAAVERPVLAPVRFLLV
jgi:hypothetical protein